MKFLNVLVFSAPIFLLFLTSCAREEAVDVALPDTVKEDIRACHNDSSWTEEKVFTHLLGSWRYYYVRCATSNGYVYAGGERSVEFKTDSTLELSEEGEVIQIADWNLQDETGNYYTLETDPYIVEVRGEIAFCEDWVGFIQSHIDGCDKLFQKID